MKHKLDNITYNGKKLDKQEASILFIMHKHSIYTLKELTKIYFISGMSFDKVRIAIHMASRFNTSLETIIDSLECNSNWDD